MNRRGSTSRLYDRIYDTVKDNEYIYNPYYIAGNFAGKNIKKSILVLNSVIYNIKDKNIRDRYKEALSVYERLEEDDWTKCIKVAIHNIDKRSHYKTFCRNKLITYLFIAYPKTLSDICSLKYYTSSDKHDGENFIYKAHDGAVIFFHKDNIREYLYPELKDLVQQYVDYYKIQDGDRIFKIDQCSMAHIVTRIFGMGVNEVRDKYYANRSEYLHINKESNI